MPTRFSRLPAASTVYFSRDDGSESPAFVQRLSAALNAPVHGTFALGERGSVVEEIQIDQLTKLEHLQVNALPFQLLDVRFQEPHFLRQVDVLVFQELEPSLFFLNLPLKLGYPLLQSFYFHLGKQRVGS